MIRICPERDAQCPNGMGCAEPCAGSSPKSLTPREKVRMAIIDVMKPKDADITLGRIDICTDAILTALASGSGDHSGGVTDMIGSGDHAELARLAEAASGSEWQTYISGRPEYKNVTHYIEQNPPRDLPFIAEVQKERDAAFIAAANPATVLALLAGIAALRVAVEIRDGHINRLIARATEAERKLAEAVEVIEFYAKAHTWRSSTVYMCGHSGRTRAESDGGNRARTFLNKEAERGED